MNKTYEEHFVTSHDGIRLYFKEYGSQLKPGIPIFCLPGLTRNSKDFESFAKKYNNEHRIVCLDLRGRGQSDYDKNKKNYGRPEIFAQDVFTIAASTNINKAIDIDTYDISIEPYEDCCSYFVPPHPETKSNLNRIKKMEKSLEMDCLISNSLDKIEIKKMDYYE